ncbi:GDP-mannose 6-dehydrogenase [Yoonia maritima]|uniref:UDP-glucose 6-dehydrogenase n=1 Tax=Yoonia maritima TaxID=1435347 RepID=A0A2T0VTC8_9RHOB|nr:nucleotide sugar dehydrogenase [Yoonia maritima]PRY74070.1 GDP-mannose 6-dehydrogenase [Yoonia maritima]
MMKVAIFGLGYVGFTAACCISSEGHDVVGVDVSDAKNREVNDGVPPFEEPGLKELMQKGRSVGSLKATNDTQTALREADLAIVCVGTPSGPDGAHDMRYIIEVSRQIAKAAADLNLEKLTVTYRSTMRPGTLRHLITPIFESVLGADFSDKIELVYNPEFLREALAINDYFHPSKIVIGTIDGEPSDIMDKLHAGIEAPTFLTGFEEAEITKFVDNSWHAVKVAFANEVGRVCQQMDISATKVHEIFVSDTKLNISPYYTRPGGAFGGSCLPKDVRALQFIANDVGANLHLVDSLLRSNEAHKNHQFNYVMSELGEGKTVLMAGLAFKADTDDLRESPNVDLARKLLSAGVELKIFDPALDPAKLRGQNLGYAYANLPTIDQLLISKEVAEAGDWDLVVVNNATGKLLDLTAPKTVETGSIK